MKSSTLSLDTYFRRSYRTWHPVTVVAYVLPLILNLRFDLPRRPTKILLAGLRTIIRLMSVGISKDHKSPLADNIPKDPRTVITHLNIEPKTDTFVCCPDCGCLYSVRPFPSKCLSQSTPSSGACGADLFRKAVFGGREYQRPIRVYIHQRMQDWVGRFLSRPGIEDLMDARMKVLRDPVRRRGISGMEHFFIEFSTGEAPSFSPLQLRPPTFSLVLKDVTFSVLP